MKKHLEIIQHVGLKAGIISLLMNFVRNIHDGNIKQNFYPLWFAVVCLFPIPVGAAQSGDFTYSVVAVANEVIITGYTGSGGDVVIPAWIDGRPVTSIGYSVFADCSGLTSITIPNSVTSIGSGAFTNCSGLTSIIIPNRVASIGGWAFAWCSGLTSITIPNSVISIGDSAFEGCRGLTSITVDENNLNYSSQDGVLFDKAKTIILCYPEGKTGAYTIPNSVTSIGHYAFENRSGLTSITIPVSITSIMASAFGGCSGLININVDENNLNYFSQNGVLFDKAKTTILNYPAGKTGISYTIPNSVTSIGEYAFDTCVYLTSITIPNGVTSIGDEAFWRCSGLTSINVDENNLNYSSQDGVLFDKAKTAILYYPAGKTGISYTIPNSVIRIWNNAFYDCSGLISITIPNSIISIGYCAFVGCSGLISITIPNSVISLEWGAFQNCNRLTSVTIPDSVTSIGDCMFLGCNGLTRITIPNSVTSIGFGAFQICGLTSVTIPDSITSIGERAFVNCNELSSAYFYGNAPASFGSNVFSNAAPGFSIFYREGKAGWTTPTWNGYPATTFIPGANSTPVPLNTPTSKPSPLKPLIDFAIRIFDKSTFQPISGVTVMVSYPLTIAESGADGVALLRQIPIGAIHVKLMKSEYETMEVDLTIDNSQTNTTIYLTRMGSSITPTPTVMLSNTPTPTFTPSPKPDDILTLIVIHRKRMNDLFGQDRATALWNKLSLLLSQETVRGEILDLDQYTSLRDKYKAWDVDSNNLAQGTQTDPRENVKKANSLAEAIKGVVGSKRAETKYAKVKYAVIIGSDAVIPFYRTKNLSRSAGSEFNYYKTLDPTHPLAAALSQDHVLSDDYYANAVPSWMNSETDMELYLPNDLMIGRLVETPEEMGAMIDAYLALQGQTDFNKAMVAGSDTYSNGADMAVNILKSDLGIINQLPLDGDDPYELADALKNLNPLNVLGLHGTHAKIFRTKKVSPLSAKAAKNYIQTMRGAVVMNWGGHGGLNLDRRLVDPSKEYENLASVFCNMGVGAYLGTTAFAGSSQKSIGFTELLGLRMIDALVSGTNSMTIGEAYTKAKQEYWLNESNGLAKSSLDLSEVIQNVADDTKVLSGMVLYGLPMFRVTSSELGKVTPLSLSKEWENKQEIRMAKVKPKTVGKGLFSVQHSSALDDTFMKVNTTDAGKNFSFNGVTQTNVNEPVQPRVSFFTGAESFFPKGAVLESARYDTIPNFDPVIEGGEWGSDTVGEGQFNKKGFFPAIPFTVNTIAKSENVPPLQKFIFIAGQYNSEKQTERLYREVRYTTYYTGEPTDNTIPVIHEPIINISNQAKVTVQGWDKDGDPLYRVVLVWTDGQGQWKSIDLDQSQASPKEWSAEFAVKPDMVFFLQAVDTLGNVTYLDNQGQYYPVKATEQEPQWNSVDFSAMQKSGVGGFTDADLQMTTVPTDNAFDGATDGLGLKVVLQPGQGTLLLASAPVSAGNGLVELKTSVRTTSNEIQLGLVAVAFFDFGPDGSLGYVNPTKNEVPVNKWGEMDLVYDCPAGNYLPAIQFILPKEAASAQTVYFDNLRYGNYNRKPGEPVPVTFDTTFDTINANLDTLNPFTFLETSFNRGEIALTAGRNKQGVLFTLLPNITNQVSRIGGYFSAPPQTPALIEASLYVKKETAGDNGMFTLAILDGEQTIMYNINANNLPQNQFKQIRIGGNFAEPGQLIGPAVVIQHVSSGKAGKIILDDLELTRK